MKSHYNLTGTSALLHDWAAILVAHTSHNRDLPQVLVSANGLIQRCKGFRSIGQIHLHANDASESMQECTLPLCGAVIWSCHQHQCRSATWDTANAGTRYAHAYTVRSLLMNIYAP